MSYPGLNTQTSTVTAPASTSGYRFTHWTINGTRVNYSTGRGANPVVFTISDPVEAVARYVLETEDSDSDGIADWVEIHYFGDLARDLAGDSDGDGFTQGDELLRGYDPAARDDIAVGGVSRRRGVMVTLDIPDAGLLDTDRDGFVQRVETLRGYSDTVFDQLDQGGASRRRSATVFAVPNSNFARITESSTPAGVFAQERVVAKGSIVDLYNAPLISNGYRYTGWFVDGVRIDRPPQNQPIPLPIAQDTLAVARYISETADTDADGIPDWMEWYFFESLSNSLASDPDGDAIPWSVEQFRGYSFVARDDIADGGVSRRRSVTVDVDTTGRLPYRMVSQPAGMVNQQGTAPPGTVVNSPDLKGSASGNYKFAYWNVNGVRQTDSSGNSLTRASFAVTVPSIAIAYYFDSTIDDDFDGLSDWYEWTHFGTLARTGTNDSDNDGLSLSGEVFRGYEPLVRDFLEAGGFSRRRSVTTAVNTVQLSVAPYVTVNGPTDVTSSSARLNALINGAGLDTTVYFEHGPTSDYGTSSPIQSFARSNVPRAVESTVTGLQTASVYHFRVVAENSKGKTITPDFTFSTLWDATMGEGFEDVGVASRWQATGGAWQVGPPSIGPGSAFAGANCAATGLTVDYTSIVDARMISPLFEVPALAQMPHLHFQHWWGFGAGDYGAVEIREGTTGPWKTAATYSGSHSQWIGKSLDLSAYVGRKIQVAFRLVSNADASTGPGWFVDEVQLITGQFPPWDSSVADTFFPADFLRDWTVTGTIWECGTPASGPNAAHEGTTCAATVLAGNYPASADSRLISPFFQVPSFDQNPRLRFWQWFQFGSGDRGTVEIREHGGAWQELYAYTGAGGGSWSKPAIDLGDYEGRWVQVAFRITSDASDQRAGWYLDEVQLVTGADVLNNPEDFETNVGDWYGDVAGLWQIGTPTSGPGAAHSGNNLAGTNLAGNYPANSVARLETPAFRVGDPGLGKLITLRWWQWHQYGTGDQGDVQVSSYDGTTWSDWVTLLTVSGSNNGWQQEALDLSPYKNKFIRVGFLSTANADGSTGAGWYVDDIEITALVLATFTPATPVTNTVSSPGTRHYYILQLPMAGPLRLNLDIIGGTATTGLYIRRAGLPTLGNFDYRSATPGSASQHILIPYASQGTYYVMVHAPTVLSTADYRLSAKIETLVVDSISPPLADSRQSAALILNGAGFQPDVTVELLGRSSVIPCPAVQVNSLTNIRATFDANTIPAGRYSVRVGLPGQTPVVVPDAVEFKSTGEGRLVANLILPSFVGRNAPSTLYVTYRNDGDAPMATPLLSLTASGQSLLTLNQQNLSTGLWTTAHPSGFSDNSQFIGDSDGILDPGESVTIPVYFAGLRDAAATQVSFQLGGSFPNDLTAVNWPAFKDRMRPPNIEAEAWDIIFANFTTIVGTTRGDYARMCGTGLRYMREHGLYTGVTDTNPLIAHRFLIANGLCPVRTLASGVDAAMPAPGMPLVFARTFPQGIAARFSIGTLGRGWFHGWEIRAEVQADGAVEIVGPGPARRRFEPDTRRPGQFLTVQPGDHGTFRLVGGNYRLQEKDGTLYVFRSDLRIGYAKDLNGNRITALYTGTMLTSLTHSNGSSLALAYNAAGRIQSVTDSLGRSALYEYDASGEHLAKVTAHDGRITLYTCDTAAGSRSRHALTSVTAPDGTVANFGYDARGWLASTSGTGGVEAVTYGYNSGGIVTATNSLAETTTFYFDHRGLLVEVRNPLGHAIRMAFDSDYNLYSVIDPAGRPHSYTHDTRGNLKSSLDPLGARTQFTHTTDYNRLASVTDANGNATRYTHDAKGNVSAITYADNSHEDWIYDATGNAQTWTNRRGRAIGFTHNAAGGITGKAYADGSTVTFAYDARGNLDFTVDPHGTTDLDYDANDRLIKITYPGARWLQFTYDSAGRRTSSLDQLGHRLEYLYDTQSRLSHMKDEAGTEIVRYEYDTAGRMKKKTLGNGVYTTYAYDAAGQLLHLVNLKADAIVLSRFDYTYDSRGRRITMDTLDGLWTYSYDDLGQLTHAVLASTNPAIPNQDLAYSYDALGNRIRTTENGVTKEYTTNNLNQYTKVGDTTYVFDNDGNLTEERAPGGTTTYAYNDENRLLGVSSPTEVSGYTYDAFDHRVATSENGAVAEYVVDPRGVGSIIARYGPDGIETRWDYGHALLREISGGINHGLLFDGLGNTVGKTSTAGGTSSDYGYRPFGETVSGNAAGEFGFSGLWGVASLKPNLNQMRVREYSSSLGRFVSPDAAGFTGSGTNLYHYANNRPTQFVDPLGLWVIYVMIEGQGQGLGHGGQAGTGLIWEGTGWIGKSWIPKQITTVGGGSSVTTGGGGFGGISIGWSPNAKDAEALAGWGGNKGGSGGVWPLPAIGGAVFGGPGYYGFETTIGWSSPGAEYHTFATYTWITPLGSDSAPFLSLITVPVLVPRDPNDCIGPAGYGPQGFFAADQLLPYRIRFENDASAAAPAQAVIITNDLSANLDWSTFRVTEIGFGDQVIAVPPGTQDFETQHTFTVDGQEVVVDIIAGIDPLTGRASCRFYTLDPATGLPPAVNVGFLPPEDGTGRGKGWFSFTIRPKVGLASGTEIRNIALIKFDAEVPIATNQVDPHDPSKGTDPTKECLLTIDGGAPQSQVVALPAAAGAVIPVSWGGVDGIGESGIARYDVFVSDDGGATYKAWLQNTTLTTAKFIASGWRKYSFYAVATDNAGNRETTPASPDTTTTIIADAAQVYSGWIEREQTLNEDLGGTVSLSVTKKGTWTAKVRLGRKTYPAKGKFTPGDTADQSLAATISRKKMPELLLNLTLTADNYFTGSIGDGVASASLHGWRHTWHAKKNPATTGYNTAVLNVNPSSAFAADDAVPHGSGFGTLNVAAPGTAKWAGILADGQPASFGTNLGPGGEIGAFVPLYKNTGSVLGSAVRSAAGTLSGQWTWFKLPQDSHKEHNYRAGIGSAALPVPLLLTGGRYSPPDKGVRVLGMTDASPNAAITFEDAGVGGASQNPDMQFTLSDKNTAVLPAARTPDNPASMKLKLLARTGLFSGAFTLTDPDPENPGRTVKREVTFRGVIPGGGARGEGFFLLPQLANPGGNPATTGKTSPILSGSVLLKTVP